MKHKFLIFFAVLTLFSVACSKDNEEFLEATKTMILSKSVSEIDMCLSETDTVKIEYSYKKCF